MMIADDHDDDNDDDDDDDDDDGDGDDGKAETEGKKEGASILIHPNSRSPAPAARIIIIIIIITRVRMYVCFGFLLARSRRARTIDLQCQSLSLCRAFLLRSVFLSLHLTVESFAVRWPTRSQNRSKITVKIDRKSIPGDISERPRRATGASAGSPRDPGTPERAPWSGWEHA